MKIKIISCRDVAQAVKMTEAIAAVKEAYIQFSAGKADVPLRTYIEIKEQNAVSLFMPAFLSDSKAMGVKIVTVFPKNIEKKLPTIFAIVIALDIETGRPMAVIEGSYLTALRTGAASGVATELLAREETQIAAVFGAGVQSRTQLEAVCAVRPIKKIWVFDIDKDRAEALVKEVKAGRFAISSDIYVADSPSQAVQEADVICTTTTSYEPVFNDADLKSGVHINGIGSFTPEMEEIPPETVTRSKVVVDSLQASLAEAGDLIIPLKKGLISKEDIHGEIGDVAAGKIPGRESDEELTFFKSVGVAIQDVAVAELVLRRSQDLGLGFDVDI
jgi:ornithine cyclodeaminase